MILTLGEPAGEPPGEPAAGSGAAVPSGIVGDGGGILVMVRQGGR